MDKDEGIRTLLRWFGYRRFRVRDIIDGRLWEIAELVEANTPTVQGRRIQLGKRLTQMNGYQCASGPNLGATLTVVEFAEGSTAAVFKIGEAQATAAAQSRRGPNCTCGIEIAKASMCTEADCPYR